MYNNKEILYEQENHREDKILWGLSYFLEISLWGMYLGVQSVERD